MKSDVKKNVIISAALVVVFLLFTIAVCTVNVAAIGPEGSSVGFSGLNGAIAKMFPYRALFYKLTNYLGYFAILICLFFAAMGVLQLIQTRSIKKVDHKIIMLGIFYVVVIVFYVMFTKVVVNYRPVLEDGALESSYPSSHTMLAVCVFISTIIQLSYGKGSKSFKRISKEVLIVLTAVMVLGRIVSGVHWFTDIIGGILLSAALLMMYYTAVDYVESAGDQGL